MVFCPPEMEGAKLHGGGEEKPDSKSSKVSEETVSTVFWKKLWLIQPRQVRNKAVRDEGKRLGRDQTAKDLLSLTALRSSGITLKVKWTHPEGLRAAECVSAHAYAHA